MHEPIPRHVVSRDPMLPDRHDPGAKKVLNMSTQTLVIIIVLVLLLGGGGGYYWRRGR